MSHWGPQYGHQYGHQHGYYGQQSYPTSGYPQYHQQYPQQYQQYQQYQYGHHHQSYSNDYPYQAQYPAQAAAELESKEDPTAIRTVLDQLREVGSSSDAFRSPGCLEGSAALPQLPSLPKLARVPQSEYKSAEVGQKRKTKGSDEPLKRQKAAQEEEDAALQDEVAALLHKLSTKRLQHWLDMGAKGLATLVSYAIKYARKVEVRSEVLRLLKELIGAGEGEMDLSQETGTLELEVEEDGVSSQEVLGVTGILAAIQENQFELKMAMDMLLILQIITHSSTTNCQTFVQSHGLEVILHCIAHNLKENGILAQCSALVCNVFGRVPTSILSFGELEGVPWVLRMLRDYTEDSDVVQHLLKLLGFLMKYDANREIMVKSYGIELLLRALKRYQDVKKSSKQASSEDPAQTNSSAPMETNESAAADSNSADAKPAADPNVALTEPIATISEDVVQLLGHLCLSEHTISTDDIPLALWIEWKIRFLEFCCENETMLCRVLEALQAPFSEQLLDLKLDGVMKILTHHVANATILSLALKLLANLSITSSADAASPVPLASPFGAIDVQALLQDLLPCLTSHPSHPEVVPPVASVLQAVAKFHPDTIDSTLPATLVQHTQQVSDNPELVGPLLSAVLAMCEHKTLCPAVAEKGSILMEIGSKSLTKGHACVLTCLQIFIAVGTLVSQSLGLTIAEWLVEMVQAKSSKVDWISHAYELLAILTPTLSTAWAPASKVIPLVLKSAEAHLGEQMVVESALKLLDILSAHASCEHHRADISEMDLVRTLLRCMKRYLSAGSLIGVLARTLANFCASPEVAKLTVEKNGNMAILTVIKDHPDNADVVLGGLRVLVSLRSFSQTQKMISGKDGIKVILRAFKNFTGDTGIAVQAAILLIAIGQTPAGIEAILERNGMVLLLKALEAHPEDTEVVSNVTSVLQTIAGQQAGAEAILEKGLSLATDCLKMYLDNPGVLSNILNLVLTISATTSSPKCVQATASLCQATGPTAILPIIAKAGDQHATNADVQAACAGVVCQWMNDPENSKYVLEGQGVRIMIQCMQQDVPLSVLTSVCQALAVLASSSTKPHQVLDATAIKLVLQLLQKHGLSPCESTGRAPDLVQHAITYLQQVSSASPVVRTNIYENGGLDIMLEVIEKYADSQDCSGAAFIITRLLTLPEAREALLKDDSSVLKRLLQVLESVVMPSGSEGGQVSGNLKRDDEDLIINLTLALLRGSQDAQVCEAIRVADASGFVQKLSEKLPNIPNVAVLQMYLSGILVNIAGDAQGVESVEQKVDGIIQLLKEKAGDLSVMKESLEVLVALVPRDPGLSGTQESVSPRCADFVELMLQCIESTGDDGEVAAICVGLILTCVQSVSAVPVDVSELFPKIAKCIGTAISKHLNDPNVALPGCQLLHLLLQKSDLSLFVADTASCTLQILEAYTSEVGITQVALGTLETILQNKEEGTRAFLDANGVEILLKACRHHASDASLVEKLVSLMASLITQPTLSSGNTGKEPVTCCQEFGAHHGVGLFMDIASRHTSAAGVLAAVYTCIGSATQAAQITWGAKAASKWVSFVVDSMQQHVHCYNVMVEASGLLCAMAERQPAKPAAAARLKDITSCLKPNVSEPMIAGPILKIMTLYVEFKKQSSSGEPLTEADVGTLIQSALTVLEAQAQTKEVLVPAALLLHEISTLDVFGNLLKKGEGPTSATFDAVCKCTLALLHALEANLTEATLVENAMEVLSRLLSAKDLCQALGDVQDYIKPVLLGMQEYDTNLSLLTCGTSIIVRLFETSPQAKQIFLDEQGLQRLLANASTWGSNQELMVPVMQLLVQLVRYDSSASSAPEGWTVTPNSEILNQILAHSSGVESILQCLQNHGGENGTLDILEPALEVLLYCAESGHPSVIGSAATITNIVGMLLGCLSRHTTSAKITHLSIATLGSLASDESTLAVITQYHGVEWMLHAMQLHVAESAIVGPIVKVLLSLSPEQREHHISQQGIQILVQCMKTYIDDPKLLRNLMDLSTGVSPAILHTASKDMVECMLQCMHKHVNDAELVEYAARVLSTLCTALPVNLAYIVESGGLSHLLPCLDHHSENHTLVKGMLKLLCPVFDRIGSVKELQGSSVVDSLVKLIEVYKSSDVEVVTWAFTILKQLSVVPEVWKGSSAATLTLLFGCLEEYKSNADLIVLVLTVLSHAAAFAIQPGDKQISKSNVENLLVSLQADQVHETSIVAISKLLKAVRPSLADEDQTIFTDNLALFCGFIESHSKSKAVVASMGALVADLCRAPTTGNNIGESELGGLLACLALSNELDGDVVLLVCEALLKGAQVCPGAFKEGRGVSETLQCLRSKKVMAKPELAVKIWAILVQLLRMLCGGPAACTTFFNLKGLRVLMEGMAKQLNNGEVCAEIIHLYGLIVKVGASPWMDDHSDFITFMTDALKKFSGNPPLLVLVMGTLASVMVNCPKHQKYVLKDIDPVLRNMDAFLESPELATQTLGFLANVTAQNPEAQGRILAEEKVLDSVVACMDRNGRGAEALLTNAFGFLSNFLTMNAQGQAKALEKDVVEQAVSCLVHCSFDAELCQMATRVLSILNSNHDVQDTIKEKLKASQEKLHAQPQLQAPLTHLCLFLYDFHRSME